MDEMDLMREAKKFIQSAHYPHVEGIFIGYKFKNGKKTDELAVQVYVDMKLPESLLLPKQVIPKTVFVSGHGIKTDVLQSKFKALTLIDTEGPVKPGYSISHPNVSAGSVGFFAVVGGQLVVASTGDLLVSCAHAISDTNKGKVGDPIYYPGVYDGGTEENTVAFLDLAIPIEMIAGDCLIAQWCVDRLNGLAKLFGSKHRVPNPIREVYNRVDCARGRMKEGVEIDKNIPGIGEPIGIEVAFPGLKVQKTGRTTEYTQGEITGVEGFVSVTYPGGVALFDGQIASDIPSAGGDSGSAVLTHDNNLVGLLFAGGEGITVMNPIEDVLRELGLSIPRVGVNSKEVT